MALLPPFLQSLLGFPVITTGLLVAPRGLGTMVAMFVVGRLVGKIDTRAIVLFGLSLMAYSLWQMTQFTADVGLYEIVYTGVWQGVGLGFIFVPLSAAAFATLPQRYRNEGTAMFSLVRNVGSSIGISIVVTILGHEAQVSHAGLSEGITLFNRALQGPGVPQIWNLSTDLGVAALDATVTRQALMIAYLNDFRLMMYLTIAAAPLLLLIRPPARRQAPA
jgi:DHA2 family multidrug resistance protein